MGEEFIINHPDIASLLIKGAYVLIGGLFVRALNKIDKNQTKLFDRQERHGEAIARLERACQINHK